MKHSFVICGNRLFMEVVNEDKIEVIVLKENVFLLQGAIKT
jgi:hypothetical protein